MTIRLRGTTDFAVDDPLCTQQRSYRHRQSKICPRCQEAEIGDEASTCYACAIEIRRERNRVRQTMELLIEPRAGAEQARAVFRRWWAKNYGWALRSGPVRPYPPTGGIEPEQSG